MKQPVSAFLAAALVLGPSAMAFAEVRYVDTTRVNCRQAASVNSPVVTRFEKNQAVSVLYADRRWSQIDNAPFCWVRTWLLARKPDAEVRAPPPRSRPETVANSLRRPAWFHSGR